MKCCFWILILLFMSGTVFSGDTDRTLKEAVLDYQNIQADVEKMLRLKCPECEASTGSTSGKVCSLKEFCEKPELNHDRPVLYKTDKGESVLNEYYYSMRNEVRSCLREKYSDEINLKKDELMTKLKTDHLKKILAANKKLTLLAAKNNQGTALSRISSEILTMSVEAGLNQEEFPWEKQGTHRDDLSLLITEAEKRLKIKLIPEIKKTLVEIQFLKSNPAYGVELEELERTLIPDVVPADPFYDWAKLTDEKAAGSAKALAENQKKLKKKSQDAYDLFVETRDELLQYLETKKTRKNAATIERAKEKVKTIKFNPPRLTETLGKYCQSPNAFYSPEDHSFTICPQMMNFPRFSLMETMAHEIAHSIDSCNLSNALVKKKGPAVVEDAPFEIEIKTERLPASYSGASYGEELKSSAVVQNFMNYADHPFSETMSCLKDPRSVGAVSLNKNEIKKQIDLSMDELKKNHGAHSGNNARYRYLAHLQQNADDFFNFAEGCGFNNNGSKNLLRSQMQEAFSDKIASEIVARKLSGKSKEAAEKAILEVTMGYGASCPNDTPGEKALIKFAEKEGCKNFFNSSSYAQKISIGLTAMDPAFDTHSSTSVRIDRNLLAHPAVRKALSCPADRGVKYCE